MFTTEGVITVATFSKLEESPRAMIIGSIFSRLEAAMVSSAEVFDAGRTTESVSAAPRPAPTRSVRWIWLSVEGKKGLTDCFFIVF
jgi:hypothetical protein